MENPQPKIGIGVLIFKEGKILLQLRKYKNGVTEYIGAGGHLELGESFAECVKRETREEAGIEIDQIEFLQLGNLKTEQGQYVDIALKAQWKSGEPQILEPDKTISWEWYDIENLPQPLAKGEQMNIEAYKTGRNYFDA